MPLARGDKEYILPVKGKNTEANLLHFPQEFATDVLNMEVDYDPQLVRPRKGLNINGTTTAKIASQTYDANDFAFNSYLWENVEQDPNLNFVVVQVGRYLSFLDDSGLADPSTAISSSKIDLNNVLSGTTEGTLALLETTRVDFSSIKGKLIVAANPIEPSVVTYDASTGDFSISALNLEIRDLQGIADGLRVDERPSPTLSEEHEYNLYNQGWYKQRRLTSGSAVESDPIAEFNSVHSEYPSNADIAHLGMVDSSGDLIFDAEWLKDQTFGGSPAPKGHFVVEAFNIDRETLRTNPSTGAGGTGGSSGGLDDAWDNYPDDPL
jgi:hypothetical protein